MKNYCARLRENSKTWEICFWWIFRLIMVYALVKGFTKKPFDITDPLQVSANLAGMFAWEIFQAMPAKNLVRNIPSYVQDLSVVGLFAASFCGKYLNFYYDVRCWDAVMHFLGGAGAVILGYEVICAMQKRDKKSVPISIVLLGAFGYSFLLGTAWELFEFTFDQISCLGGSMGDAQHWSLELALGTAKEATLFNPVFTERWSLMDTMGDIVLNTIGAIICYIVLKIYPYKHRGARNINTVIEKSNAV